jgi:riboflavin kinase/FMN adenylyltransferase
MKLLRTLHAIPPELHTGTVLTIGNFDGVHCGHQALLAMLCERAKHLQMPTVVVFFEPQPAEFFLDQEAPLRLTSLREKLRLMAACGIDYVFCIKFDEKMARLSPSDFANDYLFSRLHAKHILIGRDFRFGRDRLGDVAYLAQLASSHQSVVELCPDFDLHGDRVSSTMIRRALQSGHIDYATAALGRAYSLSGRVVPGEALARTWGFPTANVRLRHPLPMRGVFCVRVKLAPDTVVYGVANLGSRPTLNGLEERLEVHLFDIHVSLYGMSIEVFFLHKLREEKKFPSIDALISQIQADVVAARAYFTETCA